MNTRDRLRFIKVPLVLLAVLLLFLTAASPNPQPALKQVGRQTISSVELLGVVTFDTGFEFAGTEVGGLSAIVYDANRGVYYSLSDDRSQFDPARYYTLSIDLSDGSLDHNDVTFLDVTFLRDKSGDTFEPLALDPEGLALPRPGTFFISSERDASLNPPIDPFVNRFNPVGRQNRALTVPEKFLPAADNTSGIRNNLAFESLTSTPNQRFLYTATEAALIQDGSPATLTNGSPARVLEYGLGSKRPGPEYVYVVDPIFAQPDPPGAFAVNGLVELLALDNLGTFLAMERSFSVGVGNTVVLYETATQGATDVSNIEALDPASGPAVAFEPMSKEFILDFESDLGVVPDNLEGLAFGPPLVDGRSLVIVVSDNNFNPFQTTQFIALAVDLDPASD